MDTSILADVENRCRSIISEGNDIFSWSWDDRFMKALTTFKSTDKETVQFILEKNFGNFWDYKKAKKSPQIIKDIVNSVGGMEKDQLIFSSNPESDILLVGNWWPWGSGDTISLRIGMVSQSTEFNQNEIDEKIKEWFGV